MGKSIDSESELAALLFVSPVICLGLAYQTTRISGIPLYCCGAAIVLASITAGLEGYRFFGTFEGRRWINIRILSTFPTLACILVTVEITIKMLPKSMVIGSGLIMLATIVARCTLLHQEASIISRRTPTPVRPRIHKIVVDDLVYYLREPKS